jgi:hypothetical protein
MAIIEGMEIEGEEIIESTRKIKITFNAPQYLRDSVEQIMEDERRSLSNVILILLEDGLKYREERDKVK